MDPKQFQIEVAQFFIDRLKESGSWMYYSRLQDATKVYFQDRISELSDNEFWGYTRRAKEMLFELELVDISSGTLTLRADAFMMPDSTKIKDLLALKNKKDQFDAHKSQRDFYVSIGGGVIALLGLLWNIVSQQGSYGTMIGWILVGFAFGVFVSELINKRL